MLFQHHISHVMQTSMAPTVILAWHSSASVEDSRGTVCGCAGHWLGMDTHDTCGITHDQPMQEGVVLTIEPGLYIPDDPEAFGPFAGLGMRIEDDVAVTLAGPEVLSAGVPVDAHEVERIVQGKD